jgi:hypothetical protein
MLRDEIEKIISIIKRIKNKKIAIKRTRVKIKMQKKFYF